MAGKPLGIKDVAGLFGVSVAAVRLWIREGLPRKSGGGHGKPQKFDRDAVTAWATKNKKASLSRVTGVDEKPEAKAEDAGLDLDQERAQLTRQQKLLAKDKRRIIRGKYLRSSEVKDQITDAIVWFRAKLERFDETVAASGEVRKEIRARMDALLQEMADELYKIPKTQAQRQKDRFISAIDKEGKPLAKSRDK